MVVMNVMSTIEYRASFLVYMVNVVATPLISRLVWLTVSEQGVALPYDRSQFVTYYVLLSVVSMLTSTWLAPKSKWHGLTTILRGSPPPWSRCARTLLSITSCSIAHRPSES